ncbi:MAG: class I SAM-dependent methyltransferase [Gemmatimonadaceae bacterium]
MISRATAWLWSHYRIVEKIVNGAVAPGGQSTISGELDEDMVAVLKRANARTDISDHLATIYAEALELRPELIVELGTRGGESTFSLIGAVRRSGGTVVSVDIEDCARLDMGNQWQFICADDVALAPKFSAWAKERGLAEQIDVLFIDTSHLYEHTKQELAAWAPLVAPGGKIILHDTNMGTWFRRRDGSLGAGWDNDRGVVRAVEEFLGVRMDERLPIVAVAGDWLVRHHPECNGLTILRRIESTAAAAQSRP